MSDIFIQGESLHVDNKVDRVKIEGINETFESLKPKILRVGGGGGGASALTDLTDVDISTPTSGQILKYDEENDKWVNGEEFLAPAIYSTDEREVGVWIDGKPLYQKCIPWHGVGGSGSIKRVEIGESIDSVASLNVLSVFQGGTDTYYHFDGEWWGSGYKPIVRYAVTYENSTWYVQTDVAENGAQNCDFIAIVRYTKTTDVAGSGIWTPSGIPAVHYDGNEKVIGTWFGETLYEKTIELSDLLLIQGNTWTEIPFPTANISGIISVCGNGYNLNKITVFEFIGATADDGDYVKVLQTRNAGIRVKYITLRYTKTT